MRLPKNKEDFDFYTPSEPITKETLDRYGECRVVFWIAVLILSSCFFKPENRSTENTSESSLELQGDSDTLYSKKSSQNCSETIKYLRAGTNDSIEVRVIDCLSPEIDSIIIMDSLYEAQAKGVLYEISALDLDNDNNLDLQICYVGANCVYCDLYIYSQKESKLINVSGYERYTVGGILLVGKKGRKLYYSNGMQISSNAEDRKAYIFTVSSEGQINLVDSVEYMSSNVPDEDELLRLCRNRMKIR